MVQFSGKPVAAPKPSAKLAPRTVRIPIELIRSHVQLFLSRVARFIIIYWGSGTDATLDRNLSLAHKDIVQMKAPDKLGMVLRALIATAPFCGGVAQILSELKNRKDLAWLRDELERRVMESQYDVSQGDFRQAYERMERQTPCAWRNLLSSIFKTEIPKQLDCLRLDSRSDIESRLLHLHQSEFGLRLKRSGGIKVFTKDENMFLGNGLLQSPPLSENVDQACSLMAKSDRPVSVAIAPIMLSVLAMLVYIKYFQGVNIDIAMGFPHALQIAEEIVEGGFRPDACVLGDAPALYVIDHARNPRYRFCGILPPSEQRIVVPKMKKRNLQRLDVKRGDYYFMDHPNRPSTASLQMENWAREGKISPSAISRKPQDPHESGLILNSGSEDARLLLWSPIWQIYEGLGLASLPQVEADDQYWFNSMLFVKHSYLIKKAKYVQALSLLLTNAWIRLFDPWVRNIVIRMIIEETQVPDDLVRIAGVQAEVGAIGANKAIQRTAFGRR